MAFRYNRGVKLQGRRIDKTGLYQFIKLRVKNEKDKLGLVSFGYPDILKHHYLVAFYLLRKAD